MEIDGFKSKKGHNEDGDEYVDYHPEGDRPTKVLRCRDYHSGFIIEVLENGRVAEVEQGERVSSPVADHSIRQRLLNAMACLHFSAGWLEDRFTQIDLEMVRRGFVVGMMGENFIWFRKELGATHIVKRDDSSELPSSLWQPTTLSVIGVTGKQLTVSTLDFSALVTLMKQDMHYQLYNPEHDMHLKGVRTVSDQKPMFRCSGIH
jgi:hypothetical protein